MQVAIVYVVQSNPVCHSEHQILLLLLGELENKTIAKVRSLVMWQIPSLNRIHV